MAHVLINQDSITAVMNSDITKCEICGEKAWGSVFNAHLVRIVCKHHAYATQRLNENEIKELILIHRLLPRGIK